jgi:hypothetical protein
MWISESDVANGWNHFKGFMGDAWAHGHKFLNTVDRFANIGLLGAGASTGLLQGRALESGIRAADQYSKVRSKAQGFGQDVERTVDQFRSNVPELGL